MHHTVALLASLTSLGLVCAIYFCNITSRPQSWLRSEMLTMILLSLFTGVFPIAIFGAMAGIWSVISGGLSLAAVLGAGADLLAIAAIGATFVIFRATARASYHAYKNTANVLAFTAAASPLAQTAQTMRQVG